MPPPSLPPSVPARTPGTWDVIVVGAGPAGATAARVAAESGCETLLLERAAIPRYKTCGGGLIGASLAALPPGLPLKVYDTARQFTFALNGRRERTLTSGSPTIAMVYRSELDAALTDAAAAAGATVRDSTALTALEQQGDTVTVTTNRGDTFRARAVVGADGSAGRVARYVGVRCAQVDLALEAEVPVDERTADRWRGRVLMEWGPLPGSFGWVFPKGDVCTAGVVAARGNPTTLRAYKDDFLARHGLLGPRPLHDTGHLTRCRRPDSPLARGRVLVAGDAAALVDHWSREGISYALRSGDLAGHAAARLVTAADEAEANTAAGRYGREVDDILGVEMRASGTVMNLFIRNPGLVHTALTRLPPAWRRLDAYIAGHTSVAGIMTTPIARAATAVGTRLPVRPATTLKPLPDQRAPRPSAATPCP
ncbi:geranylgeranyl reductase family protein [Streptomyces sp. CB03234]|uniref:geranylgeranyl reductase family protein n=1 Tax=Streptomyces sp. (strain CB03234) TaxID=1703937 RepID=UPI0009A15B6C|nr:geranylgeranyl reductase family protein [Streptomyces sp. CB03234]